MERRWSPPMRVAGFESPTFPAGEVAPPPEHVIYRCIEDMPEWKRRSHGPKTVARVIGPMAGRRSPKPQTQVRFLHGVRAYPHVVEKVSGAVHGTKQGWLRFAGIAQLAERRTRKAQVAGPNPASGSRGVPWDAKAKVPEREQAHVEAWNRHGVKQSKAASPRTSIVHVAWVRRFRHGWSCDETGVPRSVAQSGGASGWGPEGRGSESRHSDPTPGTHKRST